MKKIILLIILAFTSAQWASAQITVTGADLPLLDYIYITYTDTTPAIALGTPGASSQSWDFTSLGQDYPSSPTYGATSATPYAAAFAESNLYTYGPAALYGSFYGGAPVNSQGMNNGYMFWKVDSTGFWIVGFRSDSGAYSNKNVLENPKELLIGTPATYGTTFNNTGMWNLLMNDNTADYDTLYTNYVTKTLTGDAWGSLTTPGGNFPNVLRIHEYLIKVDSAYAVMGSTILYSQELTRDTLNNYIYMANNLHYPACIVHADKNNVVKSVEYYYMTLLNIAQENAVANAVNIFPNPFSENATLTISNLNTERKYALKIYDVMGQEVMKSEIHNPQFVIRRGNLSSGIFFYKVEEQEGIIQTGKIIVQ